MKHRELPKRKFYDYGSGIYSIRDKELRHIYNRERMTPRHGIWNGRITTVEALMAVDEKIESFDASRHDVASDSPALWELMDTLFMQQDMDSELLTLRKREEDVLRLRFGLWTEQEMTFEEVGSVLSITRVRAREIEHKAMRKMRHPTRKAKLRAYAEERGLAHPNETPDSEPYKPNRDQRLTGFYL